MVEVRRDRVYTSAEVEIVRKVHIITKELWFSSTALV